MTHNRYYWRFLWLACLAILTGLPAIAGAQEATAPGELGQPLRYRRVKVPQQDRDLFTSGYLPMLRSELPDRLLALDEQLRQSQARTAWIQAADYSANFVNRQLVNGQATLQVVQDGSEPTVLVLSPCQLALGEAVWRDDQDTREAVLGNDQGGRLLARVEQPGQLEFAWSLRGVTNEWGETSFQVQLAPAPLNRLTIELPPDYRLFTDHGIVSELPRDAGSPPGGTRRWLIQLGGIHTFQLTVASAIALRERQQLVSIQQDALYRLADDGLELDCNIELEIAREPLAVLLLQIDPELQVTGVRLGNRDVDWSLGNEPDGRKRQLQVRFAEPLSGIHRTLQISAISPLVTDAAWQLPAVRPQDTFWRQGTMSLQLSTALELRHLSAQQAIQTGQTPATARSDTMRQFQMFTADASLQINVVRNQPSCSAIVGTTIDVEPGSVTGLVMADFACQAGQHYVLTASVPNSWMIDGVETVPAEALQDHQFVALDQQHKRLQIHLAQPLTAAAPLRLQVRAHRAPTLELRADDFRPVQFSQVSSVSQLIAIAPDPSFRLDLTGDVGLDRLAPEDLSAAQKELLQPRSGGIVFRDNQHAHTMTVRVSREDPTYTTENHVTAEVSAQSLVESYRLVVKPESTSISRFLVQLSESRTPAVNWSLKADGNTLLGATKLERPRGTANRFNPTGETWELVLRNPQDQPFELLGRRETELAEARHLSLATFPDATSQEGWLTVVSQDGTTMSLQATSTKPIPNQVLAATQPIRARARYRYDASRNAVISVDRIKSPDAPVPLWAWQCQLRTQLLEDGQLAHQATLLLESAGAAELRFRLPPSCVLTNVQVDGQHVVRPTRTDAERTHVVALPDTRYPRVTLFFRAARCEGRFLSTVVAPRLSLEIPVLDTHWTLWMAPNWQRGPTDDPTASLPPPTWSQRLLGPLAAGPDDRPFRIFAASDWQELLNGPRGSYTMDRAAHVFLQLLGEQYTELKLQADSDQSVSWRQLLQQYEQRAALSPLAPQVWVEIEGTGGSAFALDRVIEPLPAQTPVQLGLELLAQAKLAIATHEDMVLITGWDDLARLAPSLSATSQQMVVRVKPQSALARELNAQDRWPRASLVTVPGWLASSQVAQIPWPQDDKVLYRGIAPAYWSVTQQVLPGDAGATAVQVIQTRAVRALGWTVLVLTTGALTWLGTRRPRALSVAVLVAAAAAMLAPAPWTPVTAGLFLGAVLALIALAVRQLWPTSPTAVDELAGGDTPSRATAPAVTVSSIAIALLGLVGARCLQAQDADGPVPRAPDPDVFPVIVPVDEDLQPVGDYDYLPKDLYYLLHRVDSDRNASLHTWLARSSDYHAVFSWTRQRSSLDLTSLTVVYELESYQPAQQIEFPWNGNDPRVQLLEARLAGQPIELLWNNTRTAFFLTLANPGITPLEFVLLPALEDRRSARALSVPIPALAHSVLTIEAPMDAPIIEVLSAKGAVGERTAEGSRTVQLGPATSLDVQWGVGNATPAGSPQRLTAQQLSWIKVHPKDFPDAVLLDTKFRVEAATGPIESLALRLDSRLQLIPVPATSNVQVEALPRSAAEPVIVRLRQPADRAFTVHLQFLISNTSGLGRILLPRVELLQAQRERHWLAVSVANDLEFAAGESDVLRPMDAAEFLTAWGEAELAPSLCYRLDHEDPNWSLGTRSRQPQSESPQQLLHVTVGPAAMQLAFQSDVDTTTGLCFQHELSVPKDLQVTSVQVTTPQGPIAARATHDGTGLLTVLLEQGLAGPHRVELRGELSLPRGDPDVPVPEVKWLDVNVESSRLQLYRQTNVLVDLPRPAPADNSIGTYAATFGRLVAQWDAADELTSAPPRTIHIRPNQPSVQGRLVTRLLRANDTWEAIADYAGQVTNPTDGVVDQIRFEIPVEWSEDLTIEPAMPFEVRPLPGQQRHLVIQPPQPEAGSFQVRIRGALRLGVDDRGRTPNIVPLDVAHVDRFFVLPSQLDQQRIDWETSGLRLVPLKDVIPDQSVDSQSVVTYMVHARPRAVIANVQRVAGERQIGLADVNIACRDDGTCYGVVAFQVEPAGQGNCTLELPTGCQLIQVTVEGVATTLIPLAQRRWHLRLCSEQLPQQVTIVFRSQLPAPLSRSAQQLQIPWIVGFDVVRTLWTVHGLSSLDVQGDAVSEHRVTCSELESIRLRSTAGLVESAVETVLDSPATEIQSWYAPWAVRLASAQRRLRYVGLATGTTSADALELAQGTEQQQDSIAQRLNVPSSLASTLPELAKYPAPADLVRLLQSHQCSTSHYAFIGQADAITLAHAAPRLPAWWWQVAGAMLVLACGAAIWAAARSDRVVGYLYQWPYALGVLAGLAWWLFATPSILGWGIVALSVWGALRLPIPSQSVRVRRET